MSKPQGRDTYRRIYDAVRQIPPGFVCTYGDIAAMVGLPGRARQVGYALHALPKDSDVPWHRVINAKGMISTGGGYPPEKAPQRKLLEAEGVEFDAKGKVDLDVYGWRAV